MNHRPECLPCCLRRVLHVAERTTTDEWLQRKVLAECMQHLERADPQAPPAELLHGAQRRACRTLGVQDPFAEESARLIDDALALEPKLRAAVEDAADPLLAALRLSAAANWFDWELRTEPSPGRRSGLRGILEALERTELHGETVEELRSAATAAQTVVVVHASAAELLCDRLLIESLGRPRDSVLSVVRQSPLLAWATENDARRVRLDEVAQVVTPGVDCLGLPPNALAEDLRAKLRRADLVIAKGQASYETLGDQASRDEEGWPGAIFFLLRVKCSLVGRQLGVEVGDCVLEMAR